MKVRELIEILATTNPDDLVVLSRDGEGNSFSPLFAVGIDVYVPQTPYRGEIHLRELTPELRKLGYTDEDVYTGPDGQDAVVLWPSN